MKVEIEGVVYRIRFQYAEVPHELNPSRSVREELRKFGVMLAPTYRQSIALKRRATFCFIDRMDGDSHSEICYSRSVCNPLDHFTKCSGRKLALERCLRELPEPLKPHAASFLEAYHNRGSSGALAAVPA